MERQSYELPLERLIAFVNYYFARRDIYLNVFQENNQPLYVLEPGVLNR